MFDGSGGIMIVVRSMDTIFSSFSLLTWVSMEAHFILYESVSGVVVVPGTGSKEELEKYCTKCTITTDGSDCNHTRNTGMSFDAT